MSQSSSERRIRVISQQLCMTSIASQSGLKTPDDLPGAVSPGIDDFEGNKLSPEKQIEILKTMMAYREGVDKLSEDGTFPEMTMFDVFLATQNEGAIKSKSEANMFLDTVEPDALKVLETLPGPWKDAGSREAQVKLLQRIDLAQVQGYNVHLFAQFQKKYGGGLGSNIAVPSVRASGMGTKIHKRLEALVVVADPADAARLSRMHVRKDGGFEPILLDGIISTTDNESWVAQRRHLAEVFLPMSSLAEIMPVSLSRAKHCAARLAELSRGGQEVDMSDFLLHEAQAQLQLALLGAPEEVMERTNEGIRAAFTGDHTKGKVGDLAKSMRELMELAQHDQTTSLPTDDRPIRGPLSRALQTSNLTKTADYGNMLLILFAGHDTTGHTMTWMLFEMCRNPALQLELQAEVDQFFAKLGGRDPAYRDLFSLEFMDRIITETLRMWPAVPNGTFRQLHFDDTIKGPSGDDITLPKGTHVQISNWPRHRNKDLWGEDADNFNPRRHFEPEELAHAGGPLAATNPSSDRFSPFAHNPRSCLGRNFAQMEMRLIMLYLFRDFTFSLAPAYQRLMNRCLGADPTPNEFRGINRGTMGPMDLEESSQLSWGTRPLYALKLIPRARGARSSL